MDLPIVDGRNFAKMLTQFFGSSFAQIFGIRCLPGDTRTFSQASTRFLAYNFRGVRGPRGKNQPEETQKDNKK